MTMKKRQPPQVRNVTIEGAPAVIVPLKGKRACGRMLILDRDMWAVLDSQFANRWTLYENRGREYVGGALRLHGMNPRRGVNREVTLARIIMGAKPGQAVRTRSGNVCDLRRANLRLTGQPSGAAALPTIAVPTEAPAHRPLSSLWHEPQTTLVAEAALCPSTSRAPARSIMRFGTSCLSATASRGAIRQ